MNDRHQQRPRLLTREQVLAALREEREREGLTRTAARYEVQPQQLCDLLAGRTKLSARLLEHFRYVAHTFYEKKEEGGRTA